MENKKTLCYYKVKKTKVKAFMFLITPKAYETKAFNLATMAIMPIYTPKFF